MDEILFCFGYAMMLKYVFFNDDVMMMNFFLACMYILNEVILVLLGGLRMEISLIFYI